MSDRDIKFKIKEEPKEQKQEISKMHVFLFCVIVAIISVMATYVFVEMKNMNKEFNKKIQLEDLLINSKENGYDVLESNIKKLRHHIDEGFLGKIDEKKLVESALKGYVKGLGDEYTEYYTKEEWEAFKEDLDGEFYGIGIYMSKNKKNVVEVISVIKGTPAEKAGIKAGDVIYKVDGENVLSKDTEYISKRVKGKADSKVKIVMLRNKKEIEFEVERKKITVPVVSAKTLSNDIGYLKIDSFDSHVSKQFFDEYEKLEKKGMKKLIIDLRNNFGGDVRETVKILESFLPKKSVIYYTKNAKNAEDAIIDKTDDKKDMDIVILGNRYSASASEIFISALKDNHRAKMIGEKTYGKGVIQTIFETSNGGALKMTTEEYFRANKEKIHKIGIKPDIEVKIDANKKDEKGNIVDTQLKRAIEELEKK